MSGTVVAVYSRVLEPNQDVLVTEDVTVQITNITLEVDDEKSVATAGRSILKMQHLEAHPALLQAAAGYPDFDSDSEDGMSDDDSFDEEEEEDEDDEAADMSKVSKASASSAGKKAAVNGKAAIEEDDEEDDDDFAEEDGSEDDEDDEEDDFDRQEAEVQIASLIPGKIEHLNTNIILPGGEDFVFHLSGQYKVHLFGHYIVQPTPPQLDESDYSGSDYDSEDEELDSDDLADSELGMYDPDTGLLREWDASDSFEDDEEDDEDVDASDRFMEIEESPKKSSKTELPAISAAKPASTDDKAKLSKNQLKKLAKKEKDAVPGAAAPAAESAKPASKADKKEKAEVKPAAADATAPTAAKKAPSKKQTLPSGLVLEDNKVGSGAAAKSGQRVSMRYIGRLSNGKIFDQNTKGAPFSFKLGKGEVIKGWDEGIAGMQVGGERRLVIPAKLAYGKQGVAGIPPNSTLTFEVKLLSIK